MSDTSTVTTNNHPRPVIEAWELTPDERAQFDYLDWAAIEEGSDSAQFFRYKGELHDLGEFQVFEQSFSWSMSPDKGKWDGFRTDSFFSALLIRWAHVEGDDSFSHVVVGLWLS